MEKARAAGGWGGAGWWCAGQQWTHGHASKQLGMYACIPSLTAWLVAAHFACRRSWHGQPAPICTRAFAGRAMASIQVSASPPFPSMQLPLLPAALGGIRGGMHTNLQHELILVAIRVLLNGALQSTAGRARSGARSSDSPAASTARKTAPSCEHTTQELLLGEALAHCPHRHPELTTRVCFAAAHTDSASTAAHAATNKRVALHVPAASGGPLCWPCCLLAARPLRSKRQGGCASAFTVQHRQPAAAAAPPCRLVGRAAPPREDRKDARDVRLRVLSRLAWRVADLLSSASAADSNCSPIIVRVSARAGAALAPVSGAGRRMTDEAPTSPGTQAKQTLSCGPMMGCPGTLFPVIAPVT